MKFLDSQGLKVVLNRIKSTFATKAELSAVEKRIGGGTEVSEFYVKTLESKRVYFYKVKMIESESITHFYLMPEVLTNASSFKERNFITCDIEHNLRSFVIMDSNRNPWGYQIKINSDGLIIEKPYVNDTNGVVERKWNIWYYMGGVPTSEIRK